MWWSSLFTCPSCTVGPVGGGVRRRGRLSGRGFPSLTATLSFVLEDSRWSYLPALYPARTIRCFLALLTTPSFRPGGVRLGAFDWTLHPERCPSLRRSVLCSDRGSVRRHNNKGTPQTLLHFWPFLHPRPECVWSRRGKIDALKTVQCFGETGSRRDRDYSGWRCPQDPQFTLLESRMCLDRVLCVVLK